MSFLTGLPGKGLGGVILVAVVVSLLVILPPRRDVTPDDDPQTPGGRFESVSLADYSGGAEFRDTVASAPGPNESPLSVCVTDNAGGSPIPQAHVRVLLSDGSEWAGETNASGVTACRCGQARWVIAGKEGYATAYARPASGQACLEIQLDTEAVISGRVVMQSQGAAPAGMTVAAWVADSPEPGGGDFMHALAHGLGIHRSVTDSAGLFTIGGLSRGRSYTLVAGGNGLVSPTPVIGIGAPCSSCEITVWQAHAALVRARDPDGTIIPVAENSSQREAIRASLEASQANVRLGMPVGFLLSAPELAELEEGDYVVGAVSERYGEAVQPIIVSVSVPGYRPVGVRAFLPAIGGSIPRFEVVTEALTGVASLRVTFEADEATGYRLPLNFVPDGTLTLRSPANPSAEVLHRYVVLGHGDSNVLDIPGVPIGEYDATFRLVCGSEESGDSSSRRVVIGRGGGELTIAVPVCGAVCLEIGDEGALPWWSGEASVTMIRGRLRREGEYVVARGCESVLVSRGRAVFGLAPGVYTFWVQWGGSAVRPVTIAVAAGEVARATIPLASGPAAIPDECIEEGQ
ncbi:MAG: hypothetical protein HY812_05620 [Planctomycetes bacterium]|nr:hypothetical protein [Planctomycetota bacterium]